MNELIVEHRCRCPFCAEPISIVVDASAGSQSYIEDCQVCCRPMQITVVAEGHDLNAVHVDRAS